MSNIETKNHIRVIGHGMSVGDSFQEHVRNELNSKLSKYWSNVTKTDVIVTKDKIGFKVEVSVDIGKQKRMFAEAKNKDIYKAFHDAEVKCLKQMRRLKRRVKDDHHRAEVKKAA